MFSKFFMSNLSVIFDLQWPMIFSGLADIIQDHCVSFICRLLNLREVL